MMDTHEHIIHESPAGLIWKRHTTCPSYQLFPYGYLAKGYNGMVATDIQSAKIALKQLNNKHQPKLPDTETIK